MVKELIMGLCRTQLLGQILLRREEKNDKVEPSEVEVSPESFD